MLYQLVQLVYWLALSTGFGSTLFVLLAAPVGLRVVREANPVLTDVLSVNLDGQHGTLLGGAIMAGLIRRLSRVQVACGGALVVSIIGQPFVVNVAGDRAWLAVLRALLFLAAAAVAYYDWQYVWPRVTASRAEYVEHADHPDRANPALDRFDAAGRLNVHLQCVVAALLLGLVLFSVEITPKPLSLSAH